MATYNTTMTLETAYGTLEDVPCVVAYTAEFFTADPSVGEYHDNWTASAKVVSATIDGVVTMDRNTIKALISTPELIRQEAFIAETIQAELDNEELVADMTDHDTMKRIFETTSPDQFGRAVASGNRGSAGGGTVPPQMLLPAQYIKDAYQQPSMQYTPSGAHEWPKPMTTQKALAYILTGAGLCVAAVLVAYISLSMLVGG